MSKKYKKFAMIDGKKVKYNACGISRLSYDWNDEFYLGEGTIHPATKREIVKIAGRDYFDRHFSGTFHFWK